MRKQRRYSVLKTKTTVEQIEAIMFAQTIWDKGLDDEVAKKILGAKTDKNITAACMGLIVIGFELGRDFAKHEESLAEESLIKTKSSGSDS